MVYGHLRHTDNCHVTASKQQYIFQYFNNYNVVYIDTWQHNARSTVQAEPVERPPVRPGRGGGSRMLWGLMLRMGKIFWARAYV